MREICEFRWLNLPYETVREVLLAHADEVLQTAAEAGHQRGGEILTQVDGSLGGVHLEREVVVEPGTPVDIGPPVPIIKVPLKWHAAEHPGLYPHLDGLLEAYPITESKTQISIQGRYEPPLGRVGAAVDGLILHRVAEGTLEHFLVVVADRIRSLAGQQPAAEEALTEPEP